jgi:hypothetical protein
MDMTVNCQLDVTKAFLPAADVVRLGVGRRDFRGGTPAGLRPALRVPFGPGRRGTSAPSRRVGGRPPDTGERGFSGSLSGTTETELRGQRGRWSAVRELRPSPNADYAGM